jgi:hypothetical protein
MIDKSGRRVSPRDFSPVDYYTPSLACLFSSDLPAMSERAIRIAALLFVIFAVGLMGIAYLYSRMSDERNRRQQELEDAELESLVLNERNSFA